MRILSVLALAMLALGVALPSGETAPPSPDAEQQHAQRLLRRVAGGGPPLTDEELALVLAATHTDQADVNMVLLSAVVVDRRGRTLSGLKKDDFELFDEGRRRPIAWFNEEEKRPFRLVLLVDVSGSMAEGQRTAQMRAALLPLMRHIRAGDLIKLNSFAGRGLRSQGAWSKLPMTVLDRALRLPRQGRTALADALAASAAAFPKVPRQRRGIVLVSDGMDNASALSAQQAAGRARALDLPVFVLALGGASRRIQLERDPGNPLAALREVASITGGRFFLVGGPEEEAQAREAADRIRDDLRHQYALAFRAERPPDGAFHRITVRVGRKGARVLTRQGYR